MPLDFKKTFWYTLHFNTSRMQITVYSLHCSGNLFDVTRWNDEPSGSKLALDPPNYESDHVYTCRGDEVLRNYKVSRLLQQRLHEDIESVQVHLLFVHIL